MKNRWGKAYTTRIGLDLAERFDAYCTAKNRSAYSVLSLLVGQLMEEQGHTVKADTRAWGMNWGMNMPGTLPVTFATTDEELDEMSLGDVADACAGTK